MICKVSIFFRIIQIYPANNFQSLLISPLFDINLRQRLCKIAFIACFGTFFIRHIKNRSILRFLLQFDFSTFIIDEIIYQIMSLELWSFLLLPGIVKLFCRQQIGHIIDSRIGRRGVDTRQPHRQA
ncbi:unknown [Prevotella sp. CAG:924]|nr:unknown [Prevotella sp. CAG:924]